MIYQNEKATVVFDIDEKFVIGCDEERYDVIYNPGNVSRNESHDAVRIVAETDKTLKIAVVIKHDKDAVYSGLLNGEEFHFTFGHDGMTINVKTGEMLYYEKDAVQDEFDFSILDEI